jgi:hypothetical protein
MTREESVERFEGRLMQFHYELYYSARQSAGIQGEMLMKHHLQLGRLLGMMWDATQEPDSILPLEKPNAENSASNVRRAR